MKTKKSIAILCILGSACCYSTSPLFIRYFAEYLDPWTVNGIRYGFATCCLLPFLFSLQNSGSSGSLDKATHNQPWKDAIIPSIVNLIGQVSWGLSPYYVNASIMGFLSAASLLFTILFGFMLVPQERQLGRSLLFWCGTLICIFGIVLIYTVKQTQGHRPSALGMSILLISTIFFGAYPVCVRRWMSQYSAQISFATISLYTAAGLLFLMFCLGQPTSIFDMESRILLLLIASSVIGIAFSHTLFYRGIQGLGPIIASGILKATPFLTFLGATLFLNEKMTVLQLTGGTIIIAGAFLLLKSRKIVESLQESRGMDKDVLDLAETKIAS